MTQKKCYNHNCIICGRPFFHPATNKACCSPECEKIHRSQRRKAWEEKTGYQEKKKAERAEAREASRPAPVRRSVPAITGAGASVGNLTAEYWTRWRASELKYAKQAGRRSGSCVNGINVNDPDFVDKVLISIEESGAVMIACGLEKEPNE